MVVSLPSVIIGIGLLQIRSWARVAGIVISLLNLFYFPFGTILGVYGLWVLFSRDTERVFHATPVSSERLVAFLQLLSCLKILSS